MLTIKDAMLLAGNHLLNILSPEHNFLPYWRIHVDRQKRAECQFYWSSHNVGRWWDALLRLEAVLRDSPGAGFTIPPELEAPMLANLKRCLDNPLGVCGHLEPRQGLAPGPDPAGWFDDHSQREVLLALSALARYRKLTWANELGARMVRALDGFILADGSWDIPRMGRLAREGGVNVSDGLLDLYANLKGFSLIGNSGRLIEALVEFYEVCKDEVALGLADRLARLHLELSTRADGSTPAAEHIHTHSLLGTYRGLLRYGQLTRQHEFIDRIAQAYRVTVRKHVKQSGFISHDLGKENDGETAAPGDAAQLALWLARSGYDEFLDDVERIVRARILPSQITQPIGLSPMVEDGLDAHSNLDERALGAFGGMLTHAHGGKNPTTDITCADLHTLCDIYTHVIEESPLGLQVNFHFDANNTLIDLRCRRDQQAYLDIILKVPQNLFIRMPGWVPKESVLVQVGGESISPMLIGQYLLIPKPGAKAEIQIVYDLPVTILDETTDGVTYRFRWRGDEVTGISPNTDWLPLYPDWDGLALINPS